MDGSTTAPETQAPPNYLTVPSGRGFTSAQILREHGGEWRTCEWYDAGSKGFLRRLETSDGQDLQPWIVERFGSGRYRLAFYRGTRSAGHGAPFEIQDPDHPQQPIRIGAPAAPLPPAPPPPAAGGGAWSAQVTAYGPPQGQPTWQQIQEMQERAAAREREASAERLAAIRADEDERRERREREDAERRRRDVEDQERRAAAERSRAQAELDQLRERHKLDMERSRQDHELRIKAMEIERERERERSTPSAEDFAEALEEAEARIMAAVKPPEAPPQPAWMQMLAPHVPALMQTLQNLATAAQQAAARAQQQQQAAPPPPYDPNAPR